MSNNGKVAATNFKIKFYQSIDSILDASDIELGEKNITNLPSETNLNETFSFTKSITSDGLFYVFYKIDSENSVNEINEANNINHFEIEQITKLVSPYFNDFENQSNYWSHEATLGNDDWQLGQANGTILNNTFSGNKAWITNKNGNLSDLSRMHLYTPSFDLTSLSKPVLEFDMLSDANRWAYAGANISYSIDNGNTWLVLLPSNESYSKWHKIYKTDGFSGLDEVDGIYTTNLLFQDNEPLLTAHTDMNTRDIDRNTHYSIDLSSISSNNIRFRFNVTMSKNDTATIFEGLLHLYFFFFS